MIKRLILLAGLTMMIVALGSCDWWNAGSRDARIQAQARSERRAYNERLAREEELRARKAAAMRDQRDRGDVYDIFDSPGDWLTLDYACSGALRRAQWLVCEHEALGLLHRKLALQWEAARRTASPERVSVLIAQQHAFLRERNACEDIGCVSAAYNRYLDGARVVANPWAKPTQPHYGPSPAVKWVHRRDRFHRVYVEKSRGHDSAFHPTRVDAPRHDPLSCINEIGFAAANRLAERCDDVTPGLSSLCSVHNSCGGIRFQTDRGCNTLRDKPGYCRSY